VGVAVAIGQTERDLYDLRREIKEGADMAAFANPAVVRLALKEGASIGT